MNTKKISLIIIILFALSLTNLTAGAQTQPSKNNKLNFTGFTVSTDKRRVSINWTTDNTVPTNYFEIQKSTNGVSFKTIAYVMGPDPTQTSCDCYGCFEKYIQKTSKHSYYRLKHVDVDGGEQLSEVKSLAKL